MHARSHHSTDTPQRDRQHWWYFTGSFAAVLALGLVLTSPSPGQAKTFHCGTGEVQCLIDAIQEANVNGQKNTIRLAAGTYPLTTVHNDTDGPNGLPSITGEIILEGAGAETTRLERVFTSQDPCSLVFVGPPVDPEFRILHVAPTGVLTLKGITLRGGCRENRGGATIPGGGGVLTRGKVVLIQSAIVENMVDDNVEGGGGIANRGHLTLIASTILQNIAILAPGGGIVSQGTVTITDSTIADNEAIGTGGGGIDSDGTLTVTRSRIAHNFGDSAGGIAATGVTVIAHSRIEENGTFIGGSGGIDHFYGTMYITDSTIAQNRSNSVGGIWNSATLIIRNSTIAENAGGGFSGGINNQGGMLTMLNSTIARNRSTSFPRFEDVSAGMGNIPSFGSDMIGTVIVLNTIVAQNTFAETPPSGSGGPDCGGPITSFGTNLIGDPTDCGIPLQASDRTGAPGLDAFTDNDKPGHGHVPLLSTSQAIDAGNDAVCPRRDQLGQRRVDIPDVGTSRCDIGAIEFQRQDKHQDNADSNQPDMDNDQPDADLATAAQVTP